MVWTDNNPLTHILTKQKLDCCEQHWIAKWTSYDFNIKYVPGQKNIVADALSHVPFVKDYLLSPMPIFSLRSRMCQIPLSKMPSAHPVVTRNTPVSVNARSLCSPLHMQAQSVTKVDVSAVLQSHIEWDASPRVRAV